METRIDAAQPSMPVSESLIRAKEEVPNLKRKTRFGEEIIRYILLLCGVISIFTTIGIVVVLGRETSLFFQSRAWLLAKAPVAAEEASAQLDESISPDETVISLSFEGDRIPFNNRHFIQIGEETMQVTDRGRRTVTVLRGQDGSIASVHTPDEAVYGMTEVQIKPLEAIATDATTITLPESFGREFEAEDLIQVDLEVMRVIGVAGDTISVERGYEGTTIAEHDPSHTIELAKKVSIVEFVTGTEWQPQIGQFGIWPLLLSTLLTSLVGMLVAIPLGLGAAIYLSEYAPRRVRNILKPVLEILAGVPTVVFGFFALTFVTPSLQSFFGPDVQFYNMLSAGLVLGILLVPLISSISEDAINAVPRALREASYGLGATRQETTVKVVLPAAISGILAAIILATSRAVGETMIVAIAAGSGPKFTFNVFEGAETMTGHIVRISGGDLSYNSIDYNSVFAIGMMLFLLTLVLNLISTFVSSRLREKY